MHYSCRICLAVFSLKKLIKQCQLAILKGLRKFWEKENGTRPFRLQRKSCAGMFQLICHFTHWYGGWVENEDLRPKTQKRRPPLKITYKYLETGISTLDV